MGREGNLLRFTGQTFDAQTDATPPTGWHSAGVRVFF
jgi:hypothetical protein